MATKQILGIAVSISLLLNACGAPNSDSVAPPYSEGAGLVCSATSKVTEDAFYNNALANLEADLCYVPQTGSGVAHKRVSALDSASLTTVQSSTQGGVAALDVAPREYALPTVLKQAQRPGPSTRTDFNPEYLSPEQDQLLKELIDRILLDYGSPQTEIGKLRALRDWVARTIIHPYSYFHLFKPNKNTENLPIGKNWNDFADYATNQKVYDDFVYLWTTYKLDGFKLLDYAIDLTNSNAGGLMEKGDGSHYRLRALESSRFFQCTPQAMVLITLANALGYQGVLVSTAGHDTAAIYVPSLSKWIYMDPTYNEDYVDRVTGLLLSPDELLEKSFEGTVFRDAVAVKSPGPVWDPVVYLDFSDSNSTTYFNEHPEGMVVMGSQLNADMIDNPLYSTRLVQVMTPSLVNWPIFSNEREYTRVLPQRGFPELGLYLGSVNTSHNGSFDLSIKANVPVQGLEVKIGSGEWTSVPSWTPGAIVNFQHPGELIYLRAVERAGLKTSTMIVQMP